MSEMVERVARVLDLDAFDPLPGHEDGKCPDCDGNRNEARNMARMVIAAMREPTTAMIDAASKTDRVTDQYCASGGEHWESMIDAALN